MEVPEYFLGSTGRLFNPAFPLFVEVEEEPGIYAGRTMDTVYGGFPRGHQPEYP